MVTSGAADVAGLGDKLGTLEVGRPPTCSCCRLRPGPLRVGLRVHAQRRRAGADRRRPGLRAEPTGSAPWPRTRPTPNLEPVLAWGRPMLLDTSFQGQPDGDPTPRLAQLRADLTSNYPPVGPIWA